ncbi:MAG: nucleotidyltransferase family protein [Maritimibacter sp.]|nr:nucleotidyltransferase family protein [Maritimibacter sp.]
MTEQPGGPAILIPAAGRSTRMRGRDKLIEPVRGRPLLADRAAIAVTALGAAASVLVALPPRNAAPDRWDALGGLGVTCVEVAAPEAGMSASLAAGIAALPAFVTALMILPADMPDITADDLSALISAFDGRTILRGTGDDGTPGHPVLFPARDLPALAAQTGDQGGRALLAADPARVRLVPLPGRHALTDLDTPEDWAAWRARQP